MNKKLAVTIISSLLMTGFASAQTNVTTGTPATAVSSTCMKEKTAYCKMFTKEERARLHAAKAKALKADPSLAMANKAKLHDAMIKADPSVKPLVDKIKAKKCAMKKAAANNTAVNNS